MCGTLTRLASGPTHTRPLDSLCRSWQLSLQIFLLLSFTVCAHLTYIALHLTQSVHKCISISSDCHFSPLIYEAVMEADPTTSVPNTPGHLLIKLSLAMRAPHPIIGDTIPTPLIQLPNLEIIKKRIWTANLIITTKS